MIAIIWDLLRVMLAALLAFQGIKYIHWLDKLASDDPDPFWEWDSEETK